MFTRQDVAQLVGKAAFARGQDYADRGRVPSVARNSDRTRIVGHVVGSAMKNYVTTVNLSGAGPDATLSYGQCTCPVRLNCKHVAAVLLVYLDKEERKAARMRDSHDADGGSEAPVLSEWERVLGPVLVQDGSPGSDDAHPRGPGHLGQWQPVEQIALQFELLPGIGAAQAESIGVFGRTVPPRLGMRPVIRGKRERWVRTGISWRELKYGGAYRYSNYPQDQVEVLRALFALSGNDADNDYYYRTPEPWIYLDKMHGSAAWALLADARRTSLPLVQADRLQSPVRVSSHPAHAGLILDRDNGILHVKAQLSLAGEPLNAATLVFVGSPATGLYSWTGPESAALKDRPLLLAPLATPLGRAEQQLLTRPASLTVTPEDEPRFLSQLGSGLGDRFEIVVPGGDVELPEPPIPMLWLVIERRPDHEIALTWQFRYGVDGREPWVHTAGVGHNPTSAVRNAGAETALLDRVVPLAPRLGRLVRANAPHGAGGVPGGVPDPFPVQTLTGLDTAKFMTGELPGLREAAESMPEFGIEVTGDGVDYLEATDLQISVSATPTEDKRDWFDLGIMISAGDIKIPFVDVFSALASGQTEVLLPSGLHFSLEDDRFGRLRELIAEARALQDTMGGTLRVNRFQAGLFEDLEGLGVLDAQASAWREAIGVLADAAPGRDIPAPEGLRAQMREYQLEGYQWLSFLADHNLGGVLADDMGLGKTLQGLALMQRTFEATAPATRKPFLVVAPTSVVGNWAAEARKFTPDLTPLTVHETRARRGAPLARSVAGADVVITSYALFRLDFEEYNDVDWAGLILDEAQFVKNHQSVAYQCARRLNTPVKIAMTGTPFENHLMELWSIVSIVSPGLFPHPGRFAEYYQRPIEKGHDGERLTQLRRRIAPFMLRRTKEEVAKDLPAKQEQVMDVTLNPRHRKVYDQYLQRERTKVLGLVDDMDSHRFEVFRSLSVLRQAALDVSLVDEEHGGIPSSKLDVLFELLDDVVAEGHNVLIFSQFTQFLGKVRDRLDKRGLDYSYLDGRTKKRAETIERFTSGETQIFLISLKAGGFGLNLTAADYCILLDPWWNPAAEAQAVDRAHRIGQKRNVMVYRLVSSDTIEEKVMALKAAKSKLFASVLEGAADGVPIGAVGGKGSVGGAGITAMDVRELLA